MLLMVADVEKPFRNSIAHLPWVCFAKYSVGESAVGGYCASRALIFSDNVQRLQKATPVGFPEQ